VAAQNTMTSLPFVIADVWKPPVEAVMLSAFRPPTTDEDLMEAIATGDSDAFAKLVKRHLRRVVSLASSMQGSRTDCEEIAQEAFLRVWATASRWRPTSRGGGAAFKTWLYRVVLNLVIDRKRQRVMVPIDETYGPADESDDGFAHLYRQQVSSLVSAAISRLPERQRAALILCFFEGLSNLEAGRILSLSVSSVESLLSRARRALKEDLGELYQELSRR
jgi:RNA polymerase sigma-70 factor (ECF subfamily)